MVQFQVSLFNFLLVVTKSKSDTLGHIRRERLLEEIRDWNIDVMPASIQLLHRLLDYGDHEEAGKISMVLCHILPDNSGSLLNWNPAHLDLQFVGWMIICICIRDLHTAI